MIINSVAAGNWHHSALRLINVHHGCKKLGSTSCAAQYPTPLCWPYSGQHRLTLIRWVFDTERPGFGGGCVSDDSPADSAVTHTSLSISVTGIDRGRPAPAALPVAPAPRRRSTPERPRIHEQNIERFLVSNKLERINSIRKNGKSNVWFPACADVALEESRAAHSWIVNRHEILML